MLWFTGVLCFEERRFSCLELQNHLRQCCCSHLFIFAQTLLLTDVLTCFERFQWFKCFAAVGREFEGKKAKREAWKDMD